MAQEGGSRKTGEEAYAAQNGEAAGSMSAQLGFIDQELNTTYHQTVTDMQSATSLDQATQDWDTDFEQASDPQMGSRDQYAQQALNQGL